jgi:membrane protein implicated in regulation of membrane protease activity
MNIAKLIIEGALNGIGFALGAVILSAIFAVVAFLSHNLLFLVLAVLAILTWYGVKNYRETGKRRETDLIIAGIRAHSALNKRKYQEPRTAGQQPSSGRADQ